MENNLAQQLQKKYELSFFTGWMPFLPPNQQCQSTEGIWQSGITITKKYELESLGHFRSSRLLPGVLRPHDAVHRPLRLLHYCHRLCTTV